MRAKTKVPRHDYKGADFSDMSRVLNHWLNSSYEATPCEMWSVEELQELQAILLIARDSQFDDIYQEQSSSFSFGGLTKVAFVLAKVSNNLAGRTAKLGEHHFLSCCTLDRKPACMQAASQ